MRLSEWRYGLLVTFVFLLFTMIWYHAVRALINGNAIILVSLMITGALLAIRSKLDPLAGILLAFSTIKPQIVILLIPFVLLWALSRKRWQIIIWMVGGVLFLTIAGMVILPDWIIQNFREVVLYPKYNPPGTPGAAFEQWWPSVGRQLGWILSILLAVVLLLEWRQSLSKGYQGFLWTAGLTLIINQWIGIQTDPGNFIVLIFPFVYILAALYDRWNPRTSGAVSILIMVVTEIGLWTLFIATVGKGPEPQQNPIMFFPLVLFLILGMYWIKSWRKFPSSISIKN